MPIRVLIADDHALFRSGLRALLEKEPDIQVIGETENGFDTLREVEKQHLDVLLLDLSMPGLSGSTVADSLLRKSKRPAIVVLTVHEDDYYVRELLNLGARAFVLKKSTGRVLLHAIRNAYQGEVYLDPLLSAHLGPDPCAAPPPGKGRLDLLTRREQEICRLLAYGHTNQEIASKLCISDRTVETHRANVALKLGLKTRAELVRFAIDNRLLKLD